VAPADRMSASIQRLESLLARELGRVVVGADAAIRALVIALVARGHVLVQGVPGLGKTLLAKTLARALGGEFKRIQGTSDLMPSDIIGIHVFDEAQGDFVFRPGPLFADVVLVDEINRAGPKTQSALLEAMEERQVSVERTAFPLPADFLVLATQNPREFEGTYPLPESQLDRFMLRIDVDYPRREAETEVLTRYGGMLTGAQATMDGVEVLERSLLGDARAEAERIHVADALLAYVLDLAAASRDHSRLSLGLSTRGALALLKAARITAGLRGADFVAPDDVKEAAVWVMAHRLVLTPEAALEGSTDVDVVRQLLTETPVPR
jgi:MoxR-like ATPase